MSDYQEAKKQEAKKCAAPHSLTETEEEIPEQNSFPCSCCGQAVPEGAIFCPECGQNLKAPSFCTNCGAAIIEGADICEACKSWLLHDQCIFCYAHLEHDAAFCPECGNPRDGIKCPDCGNLSIFDFCTRCGKALTESAAKALKLAKADPDAKALVDSIQETVKIEAEIAKLEILIKEAPGTLSSAAPARPQERTMGRFSASKMAAILQTEKNIDSAAIRRTEEQKKADEHARKRAGEEQQQEAERLQRVHEREVKEAQARMEALEKEKAKALAAAAAARALLKSKTFASHQDARCFHNAMKPVSPRGWLCNYAGCLHDDGPNGCYCPSMGGEWII